MSEKEEQQSGGDEARQQAGARPAVSLQMLALALLVMAIPAAIPLVVIIEPTSVPFIAPVDPDDSGTYFFLIGLSAVMLIANWTIVYVIWRWLNRYAADTEHDE